MPASERDIRKLIKNIVSRVQKKQGSGAAMLMGDEGISMNIENVISCGNPFVDSICAKSDKGKYGIPFGKMLEVFGNESTGKTTFLLQLAANIQKSGGIAYWIETEHALDRNYAAALGVNVEELIISQPDFLEQVFDIVNTTLDTIGKYQSKGIYIPIGIFWDSLASIETEREADDSKKNMPGEVAKLIRKEFKRTRRKVSKFQVIFAWTNHQTQKIGVLFGSPWTTTGGTAPKYFADIRLRLAQGKALKKTIKVGKKSKTEAYGNIVWVHTQKNRCMPPHRDCETVLVYGKGFNYVLGLRDALEKFGRAVKKGNKWTFFIADKKILIEGKNSTSQFKRKFKKDTKFRKGLLKEWKLINTIKAK